MKLKSLQYIILFCIAFGSGISNSFAVTQTLSTAAPVVGASVGQNAGNIQFGFTTGLPYSQSVSINGNTLDFAGTFWTENAGWCTFSGLGTNGAKLTGTTDNMPMIGFAWCENAGWISFNPTGVYNYTSNSINSNPSDVFFTKSTGLFHGFAWSENLGWISMEGLITYITAPSLANFQPFAASGSKVFAINSPSPIPSGMSYTSYVENWDSTATVFKAGTTFTHDFRQAKLYNLTITDPFGNSTSGNVQVVADVPSDTLNATTNIGVTEASTYTGTFADSKVADASQVHSIGLKLRDQYGNPVITVPGIKDVNVKVSFNNNVDNNQSILSTGILGDAIQFPSTTFG